MRLHGWDRSIFTDVRLGVINVGKRSHSSLPPDGAWAPQLCYQLHAFSHITCFYHKNKCSVRKKKKKKYCFIHSLLGTNLLQHRPENEALKWHWKGTSLQGSHCNLWAFREHQGEEWLTQDGRGCSEGFHKILQLFHENNGAVKLKSHVGEKKQ